MWDPSAIAAYRALGVPDGAGWVVAWRLAPLGDAPPAVAAAATYSISPVVIATVMDLYRGVTDTESILAVRDEAVVRELRGDNHWALCAAEGLDDVEVGLLHAAMVDIEHYGSEEWIARSRGNGDEEIGAGWARLEAKGLASDRSLNDEGRRFRHELEIRTDALTSPAWDVVGTAATTGFCELVEARHTAFVARIDATAGPRWMPAVRATPRSGTPRG